MHGTASFRHMCVVDVLKSETTKDRSYTKEKAATHDVG